jgi:hypothetical protein
MGRTDGTRDPAGRAESAGLEQDVRIYFQGPRDIEAVTSLACGTGEGTVLSSR